MFLLRTQPKPQTLRFICLVTLILQTVQPYSNSSPPYNEHSGSSGPSGSTQAPAGAYVSRIDFYGGGSTSGAFFAIKVSYGSSETASSMVPYTLSSCVRESSFDKFLTFTST